MVCLLYFYYYVYLYFLNFDIDSDSDSVCSSYGTLFFGLISRFIFLIFFMDPSIDSDDLIAMMEDERKWDSFS